MGSFHIATTEEIRAGKTTDIYFVRTKEILEARGASKTIVTAEFTCGAIPLGASWGVLCGVDEVAHLLSGLPIDVYSFPEGSVFYPQDSKGFREPVMLIEGPYGEFCLFETPVLGLLCQVTGVATMAARMRKIAGKRQLISFGARRLHPALTPAIDRAAYIGGFDGVSSVLSAKMLRNEPFGTMPHGLVIALGEQTLAWKAFDEIVESKVPRVAIVDTYFDEKTESVLASETLGKSLYGVRLDTPASRRGDLPSIVREVRWELDLRGFSHVKIIVSGNVNDSNLKGLCEAGVDGFGIGTAISDAPTIDFAMDIVESEGKPVAKRGKLGGRKQVWRCLKCLKDIVLPASSRTPKCLSCGGKTEAMLKPLLKNGKLVKELFEPNEIRRSVLKQLKVL